MSWFWSLGFLGAWLLSRPRQCFLLSAAIFTAAVVVTCASVYVATSNPEIRFAFRWLILEHPEAMGEVVWAGLVGVVNLFYRAIKHRST